MVDKGRMGFPQEVAGSLTEALDLSGPRVGVLLTPLGTPHVWAVFPHHRHKEACSVCHSSKLEGRPQ